MINFFYWEKINKNFNNFNFTSNSVKTVSFLIVKILAVKTKYNFYSVKIYWFDCPAEKFYAKWFACLIIQR